MPKKGSKHRKKGSLLPFIKFHRWSGLISLFFVFMLSITGIMLNHTEDLQMDETYVNNHWLLSWYGINLPSQQAYAKTGDHWAAQVGEYIFANNTRLTDEPSAFLAAYQSDDFDVLVFEQALYLVTSKGELIDKLDSEKGLPTPISELLYIDSTPSHEAKYVIRVHNQLFSPDDEYINWEIFAAADTTQKIASVKPLANHLVPKIIIKNYQARYLDNKLSLEKLIQDLHSGRIMGSLGVLFMDLIAIILLLLALSGVWIWSKRLRRVLSS